MLNKIVKQIKEIPIGGFIVLLILGGFIVLLLVESVLIGFWPTVLGIILISLGIIGLFSRILRNAYRLK